MWKIHRLYLKNFAHIYSGMNKNEIEIIFDNDNPINIFIGKMGSGKTAILGHLQPFSTYGSLDSRNQDKQILPEKDGLKEIDIIRGEDVYSIQHKYTWNKNGQTHNTKSYIKLNGVELNPNGNTGAFKEIVKDEMGIEQNFLRLLRLGPNVTNLINMKSTDRKSYIAAQLPEADIYLDIYKKVSDDMRAMNAKMTMLTNKLMSLSADKYDEMIQERDELGTRLSELEKDSSTLKSKIVELSTANNILLNNHSIEETEDQLSILNGQISDLNKEIDNLRSKVEAYDGVDSTKLGNEISVLLYRKKSLDEEIMNLEESIKNNKADLNKYRDMKKISGSESHLALLKQQYLDIETKYNEYSRKLKGFKCSYSYINLAKFIDDLEIIKTSINEITSYSKESIITAYNSDATISTVASKKVSMLTGRKVNLQKQINNIKFSETYSPTIPMYRAPLCPTKSCPYYISHPININKNNRNDIELHSILNEIDSIDIEISKYQDLPYLYKRIIGLKEMWKSIKTPLKDLGVLNQENLKMILIDRSNYNWYDHSKLINILELCQMRESLYDLSERLKSIKYEMSQLESSGNIDEKILNCESLHRSLISQLELKDSERTEINKKYESSSELYTISLNIDSIKNDIHEYDAQHKTLSDNIVNLSKNLEIAKNNIIQVNDLYREVNNIKLEYDIKEQRHRSLVHLLMDIDYTQHEYDEALEERELLRDILAASSAKDGIPLVLIKLFLDNCREIVNELISDVFNDGLEILDFVITENEFKIPFASNDIVVDDIESASQGQKAIISIALSFALIRQFQLNQKVEIPYNIMLLDEMDGPLYKKDKDHFIDILYKQLHDIKAKQVFLITHNHNSFDGNPVNIIMTTEEVIDKNSNQTIYRLY